MANRDGLVIIILLALGLCLIGVFWAADRERSAQCRRRGGEYVHVYKGALCVRPGTVLE